MQDTKIEASPPLFPYWQQNRLFLLSGQKVQPKPIPARELLKPLVQTGPGASV